MLPIRYKNGAFPTNGVLALQDLGSIEGTPIDPEIEEFGGKILLPCECLDWQNRVISSLPVPPLAAIREGGVIVLNPIQGGAQALLVAVEQFKNNEIEKEQLARAVISYQNVAIRQLFGRNGMISRFIMTSRMKRSGRAVLLPRAGGDPFTCEIPDWMMKTFGLKDGSFVVVGRDPTIWDGSIEVLKAVGCESNVIRLHPLVFRQLGSDCDGDTIWVLAIPRYLYREASEQLGSFMRRTAEWPVPYTTEGKKVDWDSAEYDMSYRAAPTGFSVGPEDIVRDTGIMDKVEEIVDKPLKKECRETALGLSKERWREIVLEVNQAQLIMKVGMGPVGSAAMGVRVLAGESPRIRRSASLVSEALEQKLLSSKSARGKNEVYNYMDALCILQRRNMWMNKGLEEAVSALASQLGLKESDVRPILRVIWEYGDSLASIVREAFPLFASTTQAAENRAIALMLAERLFVQKRAEQTGFGHFILKSIREEKPNVVQI